MTAILSILLLVFAFVSYKKPTVAVGLILLLLPSYLVRFQILGLPTTLLEIILVIFLGLTLIREYQNIPTLKNLGLINWFALAFLLSGIISAVVSPDKREALGILKAFIVEPVLFFYAIKLSFKKTSDLRTPLNLLFIAIILISLYGILQYFTFVHLPMRFWGTGAEVERIVSVFDFPNALALYLAPLASFYLALLLSREPSLNKRNLILGLLVVITALALTFSRGAWIAFAVTTVAVLVGNYSWKKVLGGIGIILLVLLAIPIMRNRLLLIAHDPSSEAHTALMKAAVIKIEQNPVFGNGLFGFRTTLTQQNFPGEILNYPHNIILNFWVEMGLLGLLSFIGILWQAIQQYKDKNNIFRAAAAAYLLTMVLHGMVDVPYFKNDLSVLFWFMIAVFYI